MPQMTYTFIAGVDSRRYHKLRTKLNNAFIAGQDNYLEIVESAMIMVLYYKVDNEHMKGDAEGTAITSVVPKDLQ